MVAAQKYQYQQYAQPNPQPRRRVSEEERRRRVASKAARLMEQEKRERQKRNALIRQKRLARKRMLQRLKLVSFVVLAFGMLAMTVAGYSMVAAAKVAYNSGAKELQNLEAQIVDLEIDVAVATDISSIQEKAAALGMGFPKDYQTVAVSASPDAVTALNGGQSDFGVKDIYASVKGQ